MVCCCGCVDWVSEEDGNGVSLECLGEGSVVVCGSEEIIYYGEEWWGDELGCEEERGWCE